MKKINIRETSKENSMLAKQIVEETIKGLDFSCVNAPEGLIPYLLNRFYAGILESGANPRDLASHLPGKTILDLGCGTTSGGDSYEPYFCRIMHALGFDIIGVDSGELQEKFKNYRTDLLRPNSLWFLPDNSVDFVHTAEFFNSPTLAYELRRLIDPRICEEAFNKRIRYAGLTIFKEAERVLKPEGVYLAEDPFFSEEAYSEYELEKARNALQNKK